MDCFKILHHAWPVSLQSILPRQCRHACQFYSFMQHRSSYISACMCVSTDKMIMQLVKACPNNILHYVCRYYTIYGTWCNGLTQAYETEARVRIRFLLHASSLAAHTSR